MDGAAHWRIGPAHRSPARRAGDRDDLPVPRAVSVLSAGVAAYENSRTRKEHDLRCNRALRERTDQIRTFAHLPPPQPKPPNYNHKKLR